MSQRCDMELCVHWTGDGCICVILDLVREDRCGCPANAAGDVRCHMCGEYANLQCWRCGTPRGFGICPNPI